ncbi:MAG: NAD(P)-dependent oxidoreductase [Deltaproteobacteria bacterium]
MKVFLTGATGFIGSRLCQKLSLAHEVVALCRSESADDALPEKVEAVRGDLEDAEHLRSLVAAARPEAVVHLAARIASTRDDTALARVNTQGTAALIEAAVGAGVHRFLFASTVVTGDAGGALLTEQSELPIKTPYGRSKQTSEAELFARGDDGAIEPVVLRPSHVYGPGGWFADIVRDQARGRFLVPGDGQNLWDMVHVDDVVRAFVLALTAENPSRVYHVVDDAAVTLNEVAACIAAALGRRPPRHVSVWIARLVAGRNAIDAVVRSARSSNQRLRNELHWEPAHPQSLRAIGDVVRTIMEAGG